MTVLQPLEMTYGDDSHQYQFGPPLIASDACRAVGLGLKNVHQNFVRLMPCVGGSLVEVLSTRSTHCSLVGHLKSARSTPDPE